MNKLELKNLGTKKYLIIGAVVLLAIVLVGGTLLIQRAGGGSQTTVAGSQTTVAGSQTTATSLGAGETPGTTDTGPAVVAPQTEEVALGQVEDPPEHTLAFIDATQYSADSDYLVTFVPYGTGARPQSLIIQISESRPRGDVDKPFDFAGRNALVDTSALPVDMAIQKGGTYTGILRLVKEQSGLAEGGVLAPTLIEASVAK
jgi:hypothetical protein